MKILLQSNEDLWHLYNLVEPNDVVFSTTLRREDKIEGKLRPERMEKKKVRLGIRVEEVKFQEFSDKVRIRGRIEEGEDRGSHHTFNLGINDKLSVFKDGGWKNPHLQRIDEAVASTETPIITFVAMEYDEALIAQLYQYGIKELATIRSKASGKQYPSDYSKEDFYAEIHAKLKQLEAGDSTVIVGPGFPKDELGSFLREKSYGKTIHVYSTAQGGMLGVHEVLRSGISKVLEEHRVVYEVKLVEEFLSEIAKDGQFSYGHQEVESALEAGAVDKLLISTDMMRDKKFEPLLSLADRKRSTIITISPHHEVGMKLKKMGGIAALLRYKI
jgi:protein pelota